jgi:hypothetical protein
MKIDPEKIEELASRPGVRRVAVQNFLFSLGDMTYEEAVGNLELDARSYRWNKETRRAIGEGLAYANNV